MKNVIKITPFKLRNIHQRRGVLRTPLNIQDGDFCKNSNGLTFVLIRYIRILYIIKYCVSNLQKQVMTHLRLKPKLRRLNF